ncbi:MAG: histidinol-phosphatase [Desulfitibacter sp. BRH_c19]|nr:MAG: histidinol-phosphatase [Desulfitibacter sp. BRH_c19]
MDKHSVARILKEIGLFLELMGENPFKTRAYYNGARIIEFLEEDLGVLVKENRLKDVKGIGAALNEKITELVLSGQLIYYEELKANIPQGLMEMLHVPGLGPKKIKVLYEELAINSIIELEYACKENRLVDLKGFGAKSQENILKGIEYLKRFQGQYYYSEAIVIAEDIIQELKTSPDLVQISLAGSIRRCKETVKDIDLVASSENPKELTNYLANLSVVNDVIALGETKVSVKLNLGINLDLRVVKPDEYPYALHHFTGSKEHNTAMRHRAKTIDLKMNEYGVFQGEKRIDCSDEIEVFKALGLEFIPPELREDLGEIEAAENGSLPQLVKEADIKGAFHIHTTFSDGTNTLHEMVCACIELGYEYLGITDHSQSAFYAGGLREREVYRQQQEIAHLKEKYPEIDIYSGIESDIKPDGSLDYSDEVLDSFDFVIASVHSNLKMSKDKATERLVRAMEHPKVTMLGHPTGRLLLGREGYPLDMEQIFDAARKYNVIIELNASPARLDLDWRYLKRAKELGILITINTDAHRIEELRDVVYGVKIARKGWLESQNIFNCKSRQDVRQYLLK